MKVVVVSEAFPPKTNEVAETARRVVDGLLADESHHDVLIVTTGTGISSYQGARVVRSRGVATAAAVAGILDPFTPDVVVTISPKVIGSLATRYAQRRGIGSLTINPPALHARANVTLASSRAALESLTASGLAPTLWTPGVDAELYQPGMRDEELRAAWAKGNPLVVGHVGPVHKEKVIDRLSRVAAVDGVRLVVIGDGPGTARLRAAGAKVTLAKSGVDVARAVASIDALVQPRKREQFVPSIRQALASGVPVVGYDAGATRDVVTHRQNGLLAHPDSGIGLRRTVRLLRNDRALRDQLAERARDSVVDRTWDDAMAELRTHLVRATEFTPEAMPA